MVHPLEAAATQRRALVAFLMLMATGVAVDGFAQAPPLVFTSPLPAADAGSAEVRISPVIGERALALWRSGGDFTVGVDVTQAGWRVRSAQSLAPLPIDGRVRPVLQQIEVIRTVLVTRSASVAAGGGIREEWGGARVLTARALAAADLGGGQIEGSFVMEHSLSAPARRDAADVVTTAGWVRRISPRVAIGVEAIGQDLEGFWDAAEADGGGRLLAGPSLHVRSRDGAWSASATIGPVIRSAWIGASGVAPRNGDGRQFGAFASATWLPSRR